MYEHILQILHASEIVTEAELIELDVYGVDQFRAKIHGKLTTPWRILIWLNHNPRHTRYAYQLLEGNRAVLRWDNAPHHPEMKENFPHHFHTETGEIAASPLTGKPLEDIPRVLQIVKNFLAEHSYAR